MDPKELYAAIIIESARGSIGISQPCQHRGQCLPFDVRKSSSNRGQSMWRRATLSADGIRGARTRAVSTVFVERSGILPKLETNARALHATVVNPWPI